MENYCRVYVDKNGIVYCVDKFRPDELVSNPRQHNNDGSWNGTFNYIPKIGNIILLMR